MTTPSQSNQTTSVLSQVAEQTLSKLVNEGLVPKAQNYVRRVETSFPSDAPKRGADWKLAQGRRPTNTNPGAVHST